MWWWVPQAHCLQGCGPYSLAECPEFHRNSGNNTAKTQLPLPGLQLLPGKDKPVLKKCLKIK